MNSWQLVFWLCLLWLAYIYVGYPAIAYVLARTRGNAPRRGRLEPRVTVVLAAFNEASEIETTVRNKLEQDYPMDRLEVVVVSDGSTDGTDEILARLSSETAGRVRALRQARQGKTQALNRAARAATGEILVICDANSIYARDTVRQLVANFSDPEVGYVTGRMTYTNPSGLGIAEGSGQYISYENFLREQESHLGSIVGVDGGVDAIRRDLYVPMKPDQLPDFTLPLSVVEQRHRVVYEPRALVFEPALGAAHDEFRMRVRVSLRAMWTLWEKRGLLNPRRYGMFAWQLWSHKVLRYAAFVPLALLFAASMPLGDEAPYYGAILALQILAYTLAGLGHLERRAPAAAFGRLVPYYFVLLNAACLVASWHLVRGRRIVLWTPRVGA